MKKREIKIICKHIFQVGPSFIRPNGFAHYSWIITTICTKCNEIKEKEVADLMTGDLEKLGIIK